MNSKRWKQQAFPEYVHYFVEVNSLFRACSSCSVCKRPLGITYLQCTGNSLRFLYLFLSLYAANFTHSFNLNLSELLQDSNTSALQRIRSTSVCPNHYNSNTKEDKPSIFPISSCWCLSKHTATNSGTS